MSDPQQQDPLAALEELLKDSKSGGGSPDPKVAEEKQAQEDAAAEEQKKQEIVEMEKVQQSEDAENLRSQISDLKTIADTPQEQARLDQIEKAKQGLAQEDADREEYQIKQLGHTKI